MNKLNGRRFSFSTVPREMRDFFTSRMRGFVEDVVSPPQEDLEHGFRIAAEIVKLNRLEKTHNEATFFDAFKVPFCLTLLRSFTNLCASMETRVVFELETSGYLSGQFELMFRKVSNDIPIMFFEAKLNVSVDHINQICSAMYGVMHSRDPSRRPKAVHGALFDMKNLYLVFYDGSLFYTHHSSIPLLNWSGDYTTAYLAESSYVEWLSRLYGLMRRTGAPVQNFDLPPNFFKTN